LQGFYLHRKHKNTWTYPYSIFKRDTICNLCLTLLKCLNKEGMDGHDKWYAGVKKDLHTKFVLEDLKGTQHIKIVLKEMACKGAILTKLALYRPQ